MTIRRPRSKTGLLVTETLDRRHTILECDILIKSYIFVVNKENSITYYKYFVGQILQKTGAEIPNDNNDGVNYNLQ